MVYVDITKTELFKSFCEICSGDLYVDLHNEFDCYSINYSQKESQLVFLFRANLYNSRQVKDVEIVFKGAVIAAMNFKTESVLNNWVANIMYRGRREAENESLSEITSDGKYYYYLNFYDDYSIELFSNSVTAILK